MEGRRFLDGTYYGALKDGLREGRGTFIWDDGRRYVGGWLNDKMHGTGSLFDAEGNEIAYAVWYAGEIIYNIGDSWREHSEKKSRRFALLIGNCDYPERKLNNCLNDANALSKKLNILGFDTTLVGNATKSHIVSSVQRFTQKAKGAEAALFFFSGHGISFWGKTYMVPIDCSDYYTIDSAFVCIDDIVNMLNDVGCYLKIAIIDACRVNPTKNLSKGLYDTKARNVLFAYATNSFKKGDTQYIQLYCKCPNCNESGRNVPPSFWTCEGCGDDIYIVDNAHLNCCLCGKEEHLLFPEFKCPECSIVEEGVLDLDCRAKRLHEKNGYILGQMVDGMNIPFLQSLLKNL